MAKVKETEKKMPEHNTYEIAFLLTDIRTLLAFLVEYEIARDGTLLDRTETRDWVRAFIRDNRIL